MKYFLLAMMLVPVLAFAAPANEGSTQNPANSVFTPAPSNSVSTPGAANSQFSPGAANSQYTIQPPLAHGNTLCDIFTALYHVAVLIGIPLSVAFLVFAGFKIVWAQGRPDELRNAHTNLMWTIVGIGIFFGMFAFAQFLATILISVGFVDQSTLCQ